jgi:Cyclin, C-terminal domain
LSQNGDGLLANIISLHGSQACLDGGCCQVKNWRLSTLAKKILRHNFVFFLLSDFTFVLPVFTHSNSVLGWHVHPPTSYCFSKHFLFLMPYTSISMDARHDILELTRFLTELSVIDYHFVGKKASSVALAALFNSMDEIAEVSKQAKDDFANELSRVDGLSPSSLEVLDCRERLRQLYAQGGYNRPETRTETRNEAVSPVCVSYAFGAQYVVGGSVVVTEQERPAFSKASIETSALPGYNAQGVPVEATVGFTGPS